uniref:Transmembrane protein n=1 Tax=Palpitomonas bilix TaxID=652834 RepID=A0A7S3D0E0_9EUKA|mmetsp:Transcript_1677/g.3477  ORF Transcript_1677/g.3477 Transcript_1677/m.3477 type:complete len:742 (+) Transcript_1677:73-2298(+)
MSEVNGEERGSATPPSALTYNSVPPPAVQWHQQGAPPPPAHHQAYAPPLQQGAQYQQWSPPPHHTQPFSAPSSPPAYAGYAQAGMIQGGGGPYLSPQAEVDMAFGMNVKPPPALPEIRTDEVETTYVNAANAELRNRVWLPLFVLAFFIVVSFAPLVAHMYWYQLSYEFSADEYPCYEGSTHMQELIGEGFESNSWKYEVSFGLGTIIAGCEVLGSQFYYDAVLCPCNLATGVLTSPSSRREQLILWQNMTSALALPNTLFGRGMSFMLSTRDVLFAMFALTLVGFVLIVLGVVWTSKLQRRRGAVGCTNAGVFLVVIGMLGTVLVSLFLSSLFSSKLDEDCREGGGSNCTQYLLSAAVMNSTLNGGQTTYVSSYMLGTPHVLSIFSIFFLPYCVLTVLRGVKFVWDAHSRQNVEKIGENEELDDSPKSTKNPIVKLNTWLSRKMFASLLRAREERGEGEGGQGGGGRQGGPDSTRSLLTDDQLSQADNHKGSMQEFIRRGYQCTTVITAATTLPFALLNIIGSDELQALLGGIQLFIVLLLLVMAFSKKLFYCAMGFQKANSIYKDPVAIAYNRGSSHKLMMCALFGGSAVLALVTSLNGGGANVRLILGQIHAFWSVLFALSSFVRSSRFSLFWYYHREGPVHPLNRHYLESVLSSWPLLGPISLRIPTSIVKDAMSKAEGNRGSRVIPAGMVQSYCSFQFLPRQDRCRGGCALAAWVFICAFVILMDAIVVSNYNGRF